jgi:uncharacterized heparinase superfamily protein
MGFHAGARYQWGQWVIGVEAAYSWARNFDCGRIRPDYLSGHSHADTLSFELSLGCDRVISNSGTSIYEPGREREWERCTSAHATVEIDGVSSAET